ncbi:UNVERIFIED_CONTAM: hypothetical protein Slati_0832900 [Sesamum latifolium]|uniref:Integrase catalytic domain-containing protein n=1 Tax=Sesamum latifolium TaxID=2727402 RepID=A0AAW2XPR4_9LAMI
MSAPLTTCKEMTPFDASKEVYGLSTSNLRSLGLVFTSFEMRTCKKGPFSSIHALPTERIQARAFNLGGFSYFITFTDDHSRYGYVYLMRYKSEAFGRFMEYRLEVENQTNRKIKALRSDRDGEYLSGEFIDYLKVNEILSQWTPPGTPQLNGVAERRNRTLLDMPRIRQEASGDKLDSRSSLCRFVGYPKETAGYYFYDPAEQKIFFSKNAIFLEKGFLLDSRSDEVLIEESSEEPQHDSMTSFEPTVHIDGVPVLRRSTRESRVPKRYGFVGLTSQLDNDPKTYGETMSDIDSDKWLEAMNPKWTQWVQIKFGPS